MAQAFNRELYKEYVAMVEGLGVTLPDVLEKTYKKYIQEQMKEIPYIDTSVLRMYTLVFFLKYIKQMEGNIKFKDIYSKLEIQKKLISRAMSNVEIQFETTKDNSTLFEDWSSLYSIKMGIGATIKDLKNKLT